MRLNHLFFLSVAIFVVFVESGRAQSAVLDQLYAAYDARTGTGNIAPLNGPAHINPYIHTNENHNYFLSTSYLPGTIVYDGQPYFGLELKYDINRDVLILRTKGRELDFGVELFPQNLDGFTIDGRNFSKIPDSLFKGFYERAFSGARLSLFVKHYKSIREKAGEKTVFNDFVAQPSFVLFYDGRYFSADSRSDVTAAFPAMKKQLREFYRDNSALEKQDRIKFMRQLASFLNISQP